MIDNIELLWYFCLFAIYSIARIQFYCKKKEFAGGILHDSFLLKYFLSMKHRPVLNNLTLLVAFQVLFTAMNFHISLIRDI